MKISHQTRKAVPARMSRIASSLFMLVLFAILPFTGCKFLSMKPLTVERTSPEGGIADLATLKYIEIVFSADVERGLTAEAFSLLEDGKSMQGTIELPAPDRLLFIPLSGFKGTSKYTITVTTKAEDTEGNSLEDDFTREFKFSSDVSRPIVGAIKPQANTAVDTLRPVISVSFSEPMDATSVIDAISLKPAANGYFRDSADRATFEYVLTEDLAWQTRYELAIASSAKDLAGNELGKETRTSFFTGLESASPTIVSVTDADTPIALTADNLRDAVETVTDGVNAKDRVIIRFSEPMERDSAKNAISVTPTTRFETSWNADGTEISLTPDPAYDYGKLLCLTIARTARDLSGNGMTESVSYKFRVTGSRSRPPTVVGVDFLNGFDGTGTPLPSGLIALTALTSFAFAERYTPSSAPATDPIGFFDVHLELAEGATVNLVEFLSKFSVSIGGASITPFAAEIDSDISRMASVPHDRGLPASSTRHVVRYYAYMNNWSAAYKYIPGLMRLTLPADFSDSLGNKLGAAWSLTVNTTN